MKCPDCWEYSNYTYSELVETSPSYYCFHCPKCGECFGLARNADDDQTPEAVQRWIENRRTRP